MGMAVVYSCDRCRTEIAKEDRHIVWISVGAVPNADLHNASRHEFELCAVCAQQVLEEAQRSIPLIE